MRRYGRVGGIAWIEFLEGYDVPHLNTPADTRMSPGMHRRTL